MHSHYNNLFESALRAFFKLIESIAFLILVSGQLFATEDSLRVLSRGVEVHPSVISIHSRGRSLLKGADNVARFPDPEISISRTEGSIEEKGYYPSISYLNKSVIVWEAKVVQPIPFPGKLTMGRLAREKEAKAASLESRILENELAYQWLATLGRMRADREILGLTLDFEQKARILADTVRTRYETGRSQLTDATRAKVLAGRYGDESARLRGTIEAGKRELLFFESGLAGEEPLSSDSVPELSQQAEERLPVNDADLDLLIRNSPSVLRLRALLEARETGEDVALMEYLPDFAVFGGASRATGSATYPPGSEGKENYYTMGLTVRLPLWSAVENGARVKGTEALRRSAQLDIESEMERNAARARSLQKQQQTLEGRIRHYRSELIPASILARDSSSVSYEAGRIPFSTVIDTWQELYSLRKELIGLEYERQTTIFAIATLLDRLLLAEKSSEKN